MTDEEIRGLVLRAVISVGVDDQLRVRDVLLHDERVHRGHECWLLDRLQIVVGRVFGATSNRSMRTVSRGKYRNPPTSKVRSLCNHLTAPNRLHGDHPSFGFAALAPSQAADLTGAIGALLDLPAGHK